MNLKKKLLIVSVFTYVLIFSGFILTTNNLISKGYLKLESEAIVEQTEIGLNTLELRIRELDHITEEYASRDDTYYFIQNNMRHFINDIIQSSSFIDNELNFMIFYNRDGEILYSKAYNIAELRNMELDERITDAINENPILLSHPNRFSEVSGLVNSELSPIIVSSHPIIYSDESLDVIGTLICGRYVDLIELAKICDYSYQDIKMLDLADPPFALSEGINVWRQSDSLISGLVTLDDINGEPFLVLEVDSPRDLYLQGRNTVIYFMASMILTGVIVGILAYIMLNRFVLDRILGLSKEVSHIDPRSLESKSLSIPGDDEISKLSHDIDGMLQTINEYQDLLTKRERMATIGETAAMVGHDLRNPLQVIYMLGSRLNRVIRQMGKVENVDPITAELVNIERNLSEQTGYMNKIVSDLQDFSKSIVLHVERTDLESMTRDVLETVGLTDAISTSVVFEERAKWVTMDGNYFRRVLVNMLTNAVHAMPDGGRLSVEGFTSGADVVIKVSDTGVGVSKENIVKLFTPLFTTKAKGTGLGLAVCKRIIDAHKGKISVESEEGVGTTFTIIIPMSSMEDEVPVEQVSDVNTASETQPIQEQNS